MYLTITANSGVHTHLPVDEPAPLLGVLGSRVELQAGATRADIDVLAERGLIAAIQTGRAAANEAPMTDFASSTLAAKQGPMTLPVAPNNDQERIRRYQKAYPLATQLTAKLGLRGFRLNLAVEAADGFEGLVELLPKLRTAVGEERLAPLKAALEGK